MRDWGFDNAQLMVSSTRGMIFRESVTLIALFVSLLSLRVWGITTRFWLLEDQIRDWGIASIRSASCRS
jgi:hypothetical protein